MLGVGEDDEGSVDPLGLVGLPPQPLNSHRQQEQEEVVVGPLADVNDNWDVAASYDVTATPPRVSKATNFNIDERVALLSFLCQGSSLISSLILSAAGGEPDGLLPDLLRPRRRPPALRGDLLLLLQGVLPPGHHKAIHLCQGRLHVPGINSISIDTTMMEVYRTMRLTCNI